MEDQDAIELGKIKDIIIKYKKRLAVIVITCTLAAMTIGFMLPKEYESTTLIRARSQKNGNMSLQAASALAMLGGGAVSPIQGYTELLKSRSVLDPVIAKLDLPEEKKEKLDAKIFAKNNLRISNPKGTDLLEVVSTGRTPDEAQEISTSVVKSFQDLLTKMNQSEQSLMVKFLNDRIVVAKKEMEQAEYNLEKFRQKEKIYIPDVQAKAIMEKVIGYDKRLTDQRVQNQAAQVKIQGIEGQLQKQNAAISKYNLADNAAIQQFRGAIINKHMALIDLEQHYTDKHPSVILAKKEIDELNSKLKNEVNTAISAGTTTLNPTHAGLLGQKATIETELMVGQDMVEALANLQAGAEQDISKLSTSGMEYIGFERQVGITREVYSVLVKNYEQTRIQEAMESMDIQIVDEAELPKKPSSPKKILITAVGGVLGLMIICVYVMVLYSREKKYAANHGKISI